MYFRFRWTDKAGGKFSIRKRDAGKRGASDFLPAGQHIGKIREGDTSKTHYFLALENEDAIVELYTINRILETISYRYVYEGTEKPASNHYLTKRELEKIFDNPRVYENKTIDIRIAPPQKDRTENRREKAFILKGIKEYFDAGMGENSRTKLFELVERREAVGRELAKGEKAIRAKILKLQNELRELGGTAKADVETIDKAIKSTADRWARDFNKAVKADIKETLANAKKTGDLVKGEIAKAKRAGMGEAEIKKLELATKEDMEAIGGALLSAQTMLEILEKITAMLKPAKRKPADNEPKKSMSLKERMKQGTRQTKLNVENKITSSKIMEYEDFIEMLTSIARSERLREARNARQVKVRARKNDGEKRQVGRPGKK